MKKGQKPMMPVIVKVGNGINLAIKEQSKPKAHIISSAFRQITLKKCPMFNVDCLTCKCLLSNQPAASCMHTDYTGVA